SGLLPTIATPSAVAIAFGGWHQRVSRTLVRPDDFGFGRYDLTAVQQHSDIDFLLRRGQPLHGMRVDRCQSSIKGHGICPSAIHRNHVGTPDNSILAALRKNGRKMKRWPAGPIHPLLSLSPAPG